MKSLIFLLLTIPLIAFSQSQVKYKLENSDGYYYIYATPAHPKGVLILLPDFNETEEDLLASTELPQAAYIHGIVTIIIPIGKKVFTDKETNKVLTEVGSKSIKSYGIPENKVVLGGYGAGGTIALKYAEYCLQYKEDYPLTPAAVYAIESEVDIIEMYQALERVIARNPNSKEAVEAKFRKSIIDTTIGSSPDEDKFMYEALTPFNRLDSQNENIKVLKNTPIRLYNDTDIMWHLKNSQKSAYDLPAVPASEMINQLQLMGNTNAELIKTNVDNKVIGDKKPNTRTSVDEKNLIIWILKHLGIS